MNVDAILESRVATELQQDVPRGERVLRHTPQRLGRPDAVGLLKTCQVRDALLYHRAVAFAAGQSPHAQRRREQIIGSSGAALDLKGIVWFGFDDGSSMVDGLWQV